MAEEQIIFNCEDSLWQMLRSGQRQWDMRWWDMADDRIYRLAWGHTQEGFHPRWIPDVKQVNFRNKATRELLSFDYKGVEFVPWAPGWGFLILGDSWVCTGPIREDDHDPDRA